MIIDYKLDKQKVVWVACGLPQEQEIISMIKNYLKIAFRNILRSKTSTFINIFGLSVGLASVLLILLFVWNELKFDNHLTKGNRIYRITTTQVHPEGTDYNCEVPYPLAPLLHENFSEIERVSRVQSTSSGIVHLGDKKFQENNILFANDAFLDIFNYNWILGNPETALKELNSVILTESVAHKYFNSIEVLGNTINLVDEIDNKAIIETEEIWSEIFPNDIFTYKIYDKHLAELYNKEKKAFQLIWFFSVIAIVIACLGLFAMISYILIRKTGEIGIRKVLGATVSKIIYHLSKGYFVLIVVSNFIAWPLAWYIAQRWLENFAYRINIDPLPFIVALLISLIIVFLTMFYHTLKTARSNPVTALKYE